jgi:predicted MFS family arabinose efflux permease
MSGAGATQTRWPQLAVISIVVAVSFGSLFYAYSVLITDDAAGGRFSTTALSTAYAGLVLVGGVLAYVVGRTADRRGVRPLILIGSVLGSSGLLLLSVASEPWHVIAVSWLLMGPAAAMTFYEPAFIAVDQWFGAERRGPAISALTLVGGLAGPIFLPVTGALVESIDWRPTARVLGGALLLVGLAGAALLPGHRGDRHVEVRRPRLRNLVGERRFVLFTVSIMLSFGALQAVFFHRVAVFEDAGFAVALAAGWAGVSSLLSFPGRFAAPLVRGRFGGLFLYSVLTLAASVAVAVMVVADETWMMVAHFVLFGLAFGGMLPLRAVVMGRWFSGAGYGSIMGAQWSLAAFAGALAPWLVGVARDAAGGYDGPMSVVAGALVVSGLLGLAATAAASREEASHRS